MKFHIKVNELTWTVDGTDWNSSVLNYSVSGWWLLLVVYSVQL